jgi:hypothetical protein
MHYDLTPEHMDRLRAWLLANWNPPPPCSDCGGTRWLIGPGVEEVSFIRAETSPATRSIVRVIVFRCLDCQHLQMANAAELLAGADR